MKKPFKPLLFLVGGTVTCMAAYVVVAESAMRWVDNKYAVMEDWVD